MLATTHSLATALPPTNPTASALPDHDDALPALIVGTENHGKGGSTDDNYHDKNIQEADAAFASTTNKDEHGKKIEEDEAEFAETTDDDDNGK